MRKSTPERDRDIFTALRFARGIPSAELARTAGLAYGTVANLRRSTKDGGTRFPRNVTLDAIAKACGMKRVWVERTETRPARTRSTRTPLHAMN